MNISSDRSTKTIDIRSIMRIKSKKAENGNGHTQTHTKRLMTSNISKLAPDIQEDRDRFKMEIVTDKDGRKQE